MRVTSVFVPLENLMAQKMDLKLCKENMKEDSRDIHSNLNDLFRWNDEGFEKTPLTCSLWNFVPFVREY